jgi:23S rRNA (uridine2552-2'-O)-methyltransferase
MTAGRKGRGGDDRLTVRLRAGKRRTASSRRWLERQINDPYVAAASKEGLRSRAAFKLIELDEKFHLLAPGRRVVDLGAAPGSWTQVAVERVCKGRCTGRSADGRVVAVDMRPMAPVPGAIVIEGDALAPETRATVLQALGGPADLVLSDMSAPATGHKGTDHLRIVALCEAAFAFAEEALAPGGAFVCKVLKGGAEAGLLAEIRRGFAAVRHAKPRATRVESAEGYLVATGFRGRRGHRDGGGEEA